MIRSIYNQRGSSLVLALLVLTAVSLFGMSLALVSLTDRNIASYERRSMESLHAAEAGIANAKRLIQDRAVTFGDIDANGFPDFHMIDTLDWGGSYEIMAEADLPATGALTAYSADVIRIVAEGRSRGGFRRVLSEIKHDSFLKYARFVESTGTGYSCGAILTGEIYVGGTLSLPSGCSSGDEVEFLEMVAAVNGITNANEAVFHKGYTDSASPVDLQASVDFSDIRDRSRGTATECDCEGFGRIGIYMDNDPLGIGTNGTIDLGLFDFYFPDPGSGDTIVTYGGLFVPDPSTGNPLLSSEFNGLIFYEGDGSVRGTMDGVSGRNLSLWATDDIFIEGSVITGHTGYDDITRAPNSSGDPVNIGLIAGDYVYLGGISRVATIDAALLAVANNWRIWDTSTGAHPPAPPGNYDLDQDGIIGESPRNNDPSIGDGWDEIITGANQNITWVLNINGPIITHNGGSAYPWNASTVLSAATGPTRRYNYDHDISDFPPPCFPVPLNLWVDHAWAELYEAEE